MKSASSSFSTSSITALLRSGANILHFCYTGLHFGLTLKRCCMIFLSILGISSCFQAKTSWFALKKEIIFSFSKVGNVIPIFNTFVESLRTILTSNLFVTVQEWVLFHWSPICGSLPMLGQLNSTLLLELGLLWFFLLHGLLETSPSSDMLTSLLLVCWVQVFPRWCCMLKGNQIWGNQFPWWLMLGEFLRSQLKWRCL